MAQLRRCDECGRDAESALADLRWVRAFQVDENEPAPVFSISGFGHARYDFCSWRCLGSYATARGLVVEGVGG